MTECEGCHENPCLRSCQVGVSAGQVIMERRLGLTYPFSTNHRAESSTASPAGLGQYPSSLRALVSSNAICVVDMRAASRGTVGGRRKTRPSNTSENHTTASDATRGTCNVGARSPVLPANS